MCWFMMLRSSWSKRLWPFFFYFFMIFYTIELGYIVTRWIIFRICGFVLETVNSQPQNVFFLFSVVNFEEKNSKFELCWSLFLQYVVGKQCRVLKQIIHISYISYLEFLWHLSFWISVVRRQYVKFRVCFSQLVFAIS